MRKKEKVIIKCLNCGKETTNPKYCCIRCSAISTNKLYPRRKKVIKHCLRCGKEVLRGRKFCYECNSNNVDWSNVTLGEAKAKRKYQVHSRIRDLARRSFDYKGSCIKCGYDKHTELHHIKAIESFDDSTFISVINDPSNLIELCPNCHWEVDSKLKK